MPIVQRELLNKGVEFTNHYAASPVCAPNRTALLSGRYPHTTGVVTNSGPYGGWVGWANSDALENTFVNRLDQVGYRTAHFGKWTNFYGSEGPNIIPPGWDTWLTDYYDDSTRDFYGYYQLANASHLGLNGVIGPLGSRNYKYRKNIDPKNCRPGASLLNKCFYHTDRMSTYAGLEILDAASKKEPFYIQVDYHAPHGDKVAPSGPQPATRHLLSGDKTRLKKGRFNPNYNENTDRNPTKPFLVRKNNGPITKRNETTMLNHSWRRGLESLRSVDQGVGHIIDALKEAGQFENTYIIFTSDHGFFYGDHRFLAGKFLAYEESAKIPLVISGPGINKGKTNIPSSTIDVASTVLGLTNTWVGNYRTDGRSLVSNIIDPITYSTRSTSPYSRRAQIIEMVDPREVGGQTNFQLIKPFKLNKNRKAGKAPAPRYRAIKIGRYKYVDYYQTSPELYDIIADPEELRNQLRNPKYKNILNYMKKNLDNYKNCQGSACLAPPAAPPAVSK
jgi:arylsulfatase A-like enzyme